LTTYPATAPAGAVVGDITASVFVLFGDADGATDGIGDTTALATPPKMFTFSVPSIPLGPFGFTTIIGCGDADELSIGRFMLRIRCVEFVVALPLNAPLKTIFAA
jgi:hypothetical protein